MATPFDVYLPFDAGAGANVTEDSWRKMARHWLGTGVISGEDLELLVFGDDSGMQVKVPTGKVSLRGHYGEVTAEKTLAVTANATGSTRIDRVVARLDVVNNRIELDVVAGTVSAPALVQSASIWEISLGLISVTNGDVSIAANQVTDDRNFVFPDDAPMRPYTPVLTTNGAGADPVLGTAGAATGRWSRGRGRLVVVEFSLLFGTAGTSAGSGTYEMTLPVPARSLLVARYVPCGTAQAADASPAGFHPLLVSLFSTAAVHFQRTTDGTAVTHANPLAWTINDAIVGSLSYEAAA